MSIYNVSAYADQRGQYTVELAGLGIEITAGKDGDGLPYIAISTENMAPQHTYDEATGLLGHTRPYKVIEAEDRTDNYLVTAPDGNVIARHFAQPDRFGARMAAKQHADMLNDQWSKRCGMPIISVDLNDASIYDARDHNPALRVGPDA